MERAKKRIAIIGGGLSGLVAAYELNKRIQQESLPFEFILLEKNTDSGGMIRTFQTEDGPVDVGASSFVLRRGDIRPLLQELGLENNIQYSIGNKMERFNNHEFVSNEKPTYHGLPLKIRDILYDKELSTSEKLKVLYNYSFYSYRNSKDPLLSTKQFLDLRFCQEVSNLIAYPNYSENIYGSMELAPPSLLDPLLLELFENNSSIEEKDFDKVMDGPGTEFTLVGGMSLLVNRLLEFVGKEVKTNQQLTHVERIEKGILLLTLNKKEEIRVGSIVSTVPVSELATITSEMQFISNLVPQTLNSSMGTILFQFPKGAFERTPNGYGFVVPKRSTYHITKGTFLNRKWPSFAGAKFDYLLIDIGRRQEDTIIRLPDEAILSIVEEELKEILGLKKPHKFARVYRWSQAVPHMTQEVRQTLSENEERFKERFHSRGIFVGGNGLHGYGMQNAIREGITLANQAIEYMKSRNQIDE